MDTGLILAIDLGEFKPVACPCPRHGCTPSKETNGDMNVPVSPLGAYLRRQRSRLGAPKAIPATAHKLARVARTT